MDLRRTRLSRHGVPIALTMPCDCQRVDTELTFVLHGASQCVDVLELLACILYNIVTILRSRLS